MAEDWTDVEQHLAEEARPLTAALREHSRCWKLSGLLLSLTHRLALPSRSEALELARIQLIETITLVFSRRAVAGQ